MSLGEMVRKGGDSLGCDVGEQERVGIRGNHICCCGEELLLSFMKVVHVGWETGLDWVREILSFVRSRSAGRSRLGWIAFEYFFCGGKCFGCIFLF